MMTFANPGHDGGPWSSNWKVVAATAGFVYFAVLLTGGELLGLARVTWLDPHFGRDKAVAIELVIILPFAWYASSVVANGMQVADGWLAVAVMAITTFLLTVLAYVALAAPPLVETSLTTNGSVELDVAFQAVVAALPFASRRALKKRSTTA